MFEEEFSDKETCEYVSSRLPSLLGIAVKSTAKRRLLFFKEGELDMTIPHFYIVFFLNTRLRDHGLRNSCR